MCPGPPRQFYEFNLRVPNNLPILNYLYEASLRQIRLRLDRHNTARATTIATHSIFATETLEMWYNLPSTPIYPGVDPDIFKKTSQKKHNQILVVGNPEPQKGVDQAIEITSLIPKSFRPALVVASPRLIKPNPLKKMAKEKQVKVIWLHGQSQKQMAEIYSQSLLTLSVSHREHFGCHALESLACETPVIAVREGGYRENILDGKTGFLIERDSQLFAKKITKLLQNPKVLAKLGKNGRQDVILRWSWKKVTQKLEKLLEKTANASSK
jgi:glycosyltransferase involved in cell wall biosynthesis